MTCIGLVHAFRVQQRLQGTLGCRVGLVTLEAAEQRVGNTIFIEAIRVA